MDIIKQLESLDNYEPKITFGCYKGTKYTDLPIGYLMWLQENDIEKIHVDTVLKDRQSEVEEEYKRNSFEPLAGDLPF